MAYIRAARAGSSASHRVRRNMSHPLAARATLLYQFNTGSISGSNVGEWSDQPILDNGSPIFAATSKGSVYRASGLLRTRLESANRSRTITPSYGITVFAIFRTTELSGPAFVLRDSTNSTPIIGLYTGQNGVSSSAGAFVPLVRDNSSSLTSHSGMGTVSDGAWHIAAIRFNGTNWQCSVDGAAWTNFSSNPSNGSGAITINGRGSGLMCEPVWHDALALLEEERYLGGDLLCAGVLTTNRVTESDLKNLLNDPSVLFRVASGRTYFLPAAASGAGPLIGRTRLIYGRLTHGRLVA